MRARERILAAAATLIERSGFQAVNMVAVAQEAGVSRQTVYAHFGSREELLAEALARITTQVTDRIHAQIDGTSDTRDLIVEFVVAVRLEFRQHPVLGALLFRGGDSPLFDNDLFARAKPVPSCWRRSWRGNPGWRRASTMSWRSCSGSGFPSCCSTATRSAPTTTCGPSCAGH